MKKYISFILLLVFFILLSCSSCGYNKSNYTNSKNYNSGFTSKNKTKNTSTINKKSGEFSYIYNKKTETLTIIGKGKINYKNFDKIPWNSVKKPTHLVVNSGVTAILGWGFQYSEDDETEKPYNHFDKTETVKLPNTLKEIGNYAFSNCISLRSINIPNSVTNIGEAAFVNCKSLKEITIPGSIKRINEDTFWKCNNLKNVIIQDGVEIIEDFIFVDCYKLKTVVFPKSVTKINKYAFSLDCDLPSKDMAQKIEFKGFKGTVVEEYAKKYGFKFVALG